MEGQTLPPFVYVVASGDLLLTRGDRSWPVGAGMVIGHEFLLINDGIPAPSARYTSHADGKSCTLEMIARATLKDRVRAEPEIWMSRLVVTHEMLERQSPKPRARIVEAPGSHRDNLQRELFVARQTARIAEHFLTKARKMLEGFVPQDELVKRVDVLLLYAMTAGPTEKDPAVEHLKGHLLERVVPLLLSHIDTDDIAAALDELSYILPGRFRTHSGVRRRLEEPTPTERETEKDLKPFKEIA